MRHRMREHEPFPDHAPARRPRTIEPAGGLSLALIVVVALLGGCSSSQVALPPTPTGDVVGTVVEAGTADPMPGVMISLGGTTLRGFSGADGRFALKEVPVGRYDVILASDDAVATEEVWVTQAADEEHTYVLAAVRDFSSDEDASLAEQVQLLRQQVDALQEQLLFVKNRVLADTEEMQLFQRYFLGSSETAACRLENPERLTFTVDDQPGQIILGASSSDLLEIDNRHLGYRVLLALNAFELRKTDRGVTLTYRAAPSFSELTPRSDGEARRWRANRRAAFEGSLRHFLSAAARGEAAQEGFKAVSNTAVWKDSGSPVGSASRQREYDLEVNLRQLIEHTEAPHRKMLPLDGELRVSYDADVSDVDAEFIGIRKGGAQTSYLSSEKGVLHFTPQGHILNPGEVTVNGHMRNQRLCTLLPDDYLPL